MHRKRVIMDERGKWLTGQFWAGKRWLVLEMGRGIDRIHGCYADYLEAAAICRKACADSKILRVRILGSLLKELNGIFRGTPAQEELRHVSFVIGGYPIRPFVPTANWQEQLLFANYYPVVWLKAMDPLLAVKKYVVALDSEEGLSNRKELCSTREFPRAMLALEQYAITRRNQNGSLLLIGQLWDGSFDCHQGEVQHSNPTIIFYRIEWRNAQRMEINQVHDPTLPMQRSIPMFVRYFAQRRELAFYDGKLKRIRPGNEPDFIDLSVFDFRKTVL